MITLIIASVLMMMVAPTIRASLSEHRALAMVSALKADLEWARNQGLSTNQKIKLSVASISSCQWKTEVEQFDTVTATVLFKLSTPPHQMTAADLVNYFGVSCVFSAVSTIFNGFGIKQNPGTFVATISGSATTRKWRLSVESSGNLKVEIL